MARELGIYTLTKHGWRKIGTARLRQDSRGNMIIGMIKGTRIGVW